MRACKLVSNNNLERNSDESFCSIVNSGKINCSWSSEATFLEWIRLMSLKLCIFILLKTKNEVILQTATCCKMTCIVN